jgi:tRNA threonylcarbamoyladenosine biosynthesis protein TsaE
MLELRAASLVDTHAIAASVAVLCRPGDLVVLAGEMGAGKTAFAKGFGAALGVTEPITSPTFTLVHTYDLAPGNGTGAAALHHADLYRLDRTAEVADLALDELAENAGIVLVEWGDVVDSLFGDHLMVHLEPDLDVEVDTAAAEPDSGDGDPADGARWITLSATGSTWAARWSRLVDACEAYRC